MPAAVPERGEVWMVDFGLAAKVRPAVVVSIPFGDTDRSIIGVVPHTTALRGSQFEIAAQVRFLDRDGAFLLQGFATMPPRHFVRSPGKLSAEQMMLIEKQVIYDGPASGLSTCKDARVRQFVLGEARDRLTDERLLSEPEA